jgi:hypothetical protein
VLARRFLGQPPPVLFPEFFVHGRQFGSYPETGLGEINGDFLEADLSVLIAGISARASTHPLRGLSAAAQGKFVTFGVTRGCIAVASPVSSITRLIPP